jgi:DNA-binding transcriptional MocR family regulator
MLHVPSFFDVELTDMKGCIVSQNNKHVRMATSITIAQSPGTSVLSSVATKALIDSPKLPLLLSNQQTRLLASYNVLVGFLKRHGIEYIPATAGLFLMVRLSTDSTSLEKELAMASKFEEYGLILGCGYNYHMGETRFGYFRITFAVPRERLELGLCRLALALGLSE